MGKILKFGSFILIATLLSFSFYSCDETECSDSTVVEFNINFYDKYDLSQYGDTLAIYGLRQKTDSLIADTAFINKAQKLPLRISETETAFVFDFVNRRDSVFIQDTVYVYHQNNVHFISEPCGCVMFHLIDSLSYTKNKIDSIAINYKDVTNEPQENLQLFFR